MRGAVPEHVQVGSVSIPIATAQLWVAEYTNVENVSAKKPYAYPAYDRYESRRNDPLRLTDADLLAPALLNVPVKIRSYYGLQRICAELEAALANPQLERPLADLESPDLIASVVKPLYAPLDDPQRKPWNVNATTLSKVLHRKRPECLVLHDIWVNKCYVGPNRPVARVARRSWADYMAEITIAIGNDIRTQRDGFVILDSAVRSPEKLSHVRLLDILAWKSQGSTPREAPETI